MSTLLNGEHLSFSHLLLNNVGSGYLLNRVSRAPNVVCSVTRRTKSGFGPNEPEKGQTHEFDPNLVNKGLKSLDNPVLRGSFTLVLSVERLDFLDNIAKDAWKEITSYGLRTVTASSPQNSTIKLKTCPPNAVQSNRGGVYVIQNVENGKAVVGQTKDLKTRFNQYSARGSRSTPVVGDNINRAYYKAAQEVIARTGVNTNVAFQRYIVYVWVNEAGEPLDLENSRDLRNEMIYLEHRLMLAFYECGLAYNTNDSAPQLNDSVKLEPSLAVTETVPQPIGGIKESKPFKVSGKCFYSMSDYWAYQDSIGQSRVNRQRLRDLLRSNSNNIESDTRYLTEDEIKYCEENNLFIIKERQYPMNKPKYKYK